IVNGILKFGTGQSGGAACRPHSWRGKGCRFANSAPARFEQDPRSIAVLQTRIDQSRALGDSGIRKIMKPAISGNASAASGDTNVKTAAGTSPAINRSIAFASPLLSWASAAPAATIAVLTLPLDADGAPSIATFLLARSDIDFISGRAMTRATRRSGSIAAADAVMSASRGGAGSPRSARWVLTAFGSGAAAATVIRSATTVAAVTWSRRVLVLETAAA